MLENKKVKNMTQEEKDIIIKNYIDIYMDNAFTKKFIIGSQIKSGVYAIFEGKLDKKQMFEICYLCDGLKVRIKDTLETTKKLLSFGFVRASEASFTNDDLKAIYSNNRGMTFEILACDTLELKQTAHGLKFTEGGDAIDKNGVHYQIKLTSATVLEQSFYEKLKAQTICTKCTTKVVHLHKMIVKIRQTKRYKLQCI